MNKETKFIVGGFLIMILALASPILISAFSTGKAFQISIVSIIFLIFTLLGLNLIADALIKKG